jgi:hypothetical protein
VAIAFNATACSLVTVGKSSRYSSSDIPASR